MFKEPTYIGIGDQYGKRESTKEEQPNLNLKATRRRTGKVCRRGAHMVEGYNISN